MGFGSFLRSLFKRPSPPASNLVPFYDVPSRRVVHIPPAELRPGCIQARVEGIDEIVWLLPEQLQQSEIRHPPFTEEIRDYIRIVHMAFAEHRPISFEEWEDGFRRDAHPEREIAIFVHAAYVYAEATEHEESAQRRHEIYQLLIACMTTSPESVWHVVKLNSVTRDEAEAIANRFYRGDGEDAPT